LPPRPARPRHPTSLPDPGWMAGSAVRTGRLICDQKIPEGAKFKSRRGHDRHGRQSLVEAFTDMRSSIPAQYLGLVRLFCALEQLDLLRAPLLGDFTILRRNRIRINELLRRTDAEPRRKDQDRADLQGPSGGRSVNRCANPRGFHHCPKDASTTKRFR
jgi:hypothetical protein